MGPVGDFLDVDMRSVQMIRFRGMAPLPTPPILGGPDADAPDADHPADATDPGPTSPFGKLNIWGETGGKIWGVKGNYSRLKNKLNRCWFHFLCYVHLENWGRNHI